MKRSSLLPRLLIVIMMAISLPGCRTDEPKDQVSTLVVAAASDLMIAFEVIGRLFEKETGARVSFNFGSTGQLAQQIEQGAPVDLFAAANVAFVEELEQKGMVLAGTKQLYAQGRIAIWTRSDGRVKPNRIEDLVDPGIRRIAIANPDHAPYGIAAREALISAGVWEKVKDKLVFGENVRQTLQFAETGNVEVAIVALSLSVGSEGHWALIPAELHKPLNQALAVIKGSRNEALAQRFAEFLNGPKGRPVMRQYGFVLPGEEMSQ